MSPGGWILTRLALAFCNLPRLASRCSAQFCVPTTRAAPAWPRAIGHSAKLVRSIVATALARRRGTGSCLACLTFRESQAIQRKRPANSLVPGILGLADAALLWGVVCSPRSAGCEMWFHLASGILRQAIPSCFGRSVSRRRLLHSFAAFQLRSLSSSLEIACSQKGA